MRGVNALFMIIILAIVAYSDTTWVSDTVSGTWTSAGNPYILTGNCYVADGESLFVEEGVRIISADTTGFTLHGGCRLFLNGSPSEPVYITKIGLSSAHIVSYCVIESCATAINSADSIIGSIIGYSEYGIKANGYMKYCLNSIIHHCGYGTYACGEIEF